MENYENLFNLLRKEKPDVRKITIDSYLKYIINLHNEIYGNKKVESLKWLNDFSKIMDTIKDKTYLTQRNILNSVIVGLHSDNGKESIIEKFSELRDNFNKKYLEDVKNGVSSKKSENIISRKELDDFINQFEKIIKIKKCKSNKNMNEKELHEFQLYVILKFYQKYPLRSDLCTFQFINSSDERDDDINYYLWDKGEIIMNEYKTSKKYGNYTIDLDKEINGLFKCLIKKKIVKNNNYLITKKTGEPYNKQEFSNLIIKFFKVRIGKNIGVTALRRIYLQKYSSVKEEMKQDAQIMGHSVATQQGVYVSDKQD